MKVSKVEVFISTSVGYCIISLFWNKWIVTSKEIAEMIFIGTLGGLFLALLMNLIMRLITRLVEKIVRK
jgi:hypothetical protein